MKKKSLLLIVGCAMATFKLVAQLSGIVTSNNSAPIQDVLVCNITKNNCVKTTQQGAFTIPAADNDVISFSHVNFAVQTLTIISANRAAPQLIVLQLIPTSQKAPQAPSSHWIGAKIGYNFDGFTDNDNDFIGAAKIKLNLVDRGTDDNFADYGVIGNISDFISNVDKEDSDKDLEKLILSVTGLNIGMYGEWFFKPKEANSENRKRSNSSIYFTAGYRLNTYKNATVDSITVNLSQFKSSIGFQFEGLKFTEKGRLNLSLEGSVYAFGASRYEKIFSEKKSILFSLEIGTIIPIKEKIGFFISGTVAPKTKGVFLAGIILKS